MNNPWGISGPAFLWLYLGAFGLALVALSVLRRVGRAGSLSRAGHEPLTVEETAYLSGGWPRMVESAIAGLLARNVVRLERNGYLYKVSKAAQGPESELEDAVVRAVDRRSGRTVGQIQRELFGNPRFDQVHRALEARGLAYGGSRAWRAVAPLLVLFAVGVARWINGLNLGFPVGYLTALLVLTLITIVFGVRPIKPGVTKAGRKVLAERGSSSDTAATVALGGLTAYPDKDTAKVFRKRRTSHASADSGAGFAFWGASATSTSSCGGSSSSGSSCGSSSSGSSCGGGGGGCGGGGS